MISQDIHRLIIKYLTRQATLLERNKLELWLEDLDNYKMFKEFVKINYLIDLNMEMFDSDDSKKELLELIDKEKKQYRFRKYIRVMKYAAIFVGIIATTYFFKDNIFTKSVETTPIIVDTNVIEPGTDKAKLTLGDGSQIALEKGESLKTQNASSNGEEIIYKANQGNAKELAYNHLTIPRGGQFYIVLSDGTRVWLNSETQLKYPVSFIDGKARQVELVYGEAYFEVSPSTEHKGAKFKVLNQSQEIEVLGTEFNIKAYRDETSIYTTLVEGRVSVNYENRKQNLMPNQQSSLDINTKNFLVREVDVYNEISWKEGVFSFERKPLKEIMKVLSRWYDVDIIFDNKSLEEVKFFGVLGKDQKIEEILETIKNFKIIEAYEIKGKTIILK
ncbi:FecR family protein [Hyunsoonleella ulvae]|uniref:FecR family protein n=1 Tax=Hyunsoonleella ulvae TaxID=2799948 RepID=UPI00193AD8D2|nr:FecR family protein [Hyunsoonleella ulvae]